jgi:cation:H+ antiporter
LGEVITGTLFLGCTTSLPGLAASITAVLDGRPALAISNAIGGIAIQTTFLTIADIAYTRANLEHAAASATNMIQTAMLVVLLALTLLGLTGPQVTIAHVHPMTPVLFLAAGTGFWLVYRSSTEPMWKPEQTAETVEDIPAEAHRRNSLGKLLGGFVLTAGAATAAGAVAAYMTGNIADATGLSETVAGGLFSGVATSLPELVTTVAAVRRRALTLAVSDIVGGNFFDVLFVFAADLVYLPGSLY